MHIHSNAYESLHMFVCIQSLRHWDRCSVKWDRPSRHAQILLGLKTQGSWVSSRMLLCVFLCGVCVCVCVLACGRERERDGMRESDRASARERPCACGRERERDGVRDSDRESARERLCLRERV